ncbi:helix-turn-helix domain-containing protein [Eubacterium pyruvativorans]|uniref:helix-turn-helix domain-containing protein n=1 Tax=Eubacterium pyruvativorans TaxID=155865 RepID=UPI003F88FCC6
MSSNIGERIRELRLKKSLTMDELAKRIGYNSRASISRVEHGETDLPLSKVKDFANALDTTPAYLMGWTDDPYEEEYDYENDPQHRLDEYCGAQWDALVEANNGDLAAAKEAYDHLWDEDPHIEPHKNLYGLQDVYLNFAKEAQANGIDPDDIRDVINILKKNRK